MKNEAFPLAQKTINQSFMYCSMRKEGDEIIEWNSSSRDIFNFIRALSYINSQQIKIKKAAFIKNAPIYIGIPGSIIDLDTDCFFVKTKDSYLKILEWEYNLPLKRGMRLSKRS